MTTLSVVNYMLSLINVQPIADLDEALDELSLGAKALAVINSERRLLLAAGFPFNTTEQTLPKDASGQVPIPSDVLSVAPVSHGVHAVVNNGFLYNMVLRNFTWESDSTLYLGNDSVDGVPLLTIIWDMELSKLPVEFSEHIVALASRRFAAANSASPDTLQMCLEQIVKTKDAYMRWTCSSLRANINDSDTQHQLLSRSYNPMRRW